MTTAERLRESAERYWNPAGRIEICRQAADELDQRDDTITTLRAERDVLQAEKSLTMKHVQALFKERDDLRSTAQSLLDELFPLRATAQRRLELLRTMQWCCSVTGILTEGRCPKCFGCDPHHSPDCPLAQELKEGGK